VVGGAASAKRLGFAVLVGDSGDIAEFEIHATPAVYFYGS
jgi:hypothetical protein